MITKDLTLLTLLVLLLHIADFEKLGHGYNEVLCHYIVRPCIYIVKKICVTRKRVVLLGLVPLHLAPVCVKFTFYKNIRDAVKSSRRLMLASSLRSSIFSQVLSFRYFVLHNCVVEVLVCELGVALRSIADIKPEALRDFYSEFSRLRRYGVTFVDVCARNLVLSRDRSKVKICDYECVTINLA